MNLIPLVLFIALVAVVVALFAWALTKFQNASRPTSDRRKWALSLRLAFWLLPLFVERVFWAMGFKRHFGGGIQFANIGEGSFETGTKSYTPDGVTTTRYLLYKIGTDGDHCAITGAGDTPLGQSNDQADSGVPVAINLFGLKPGTLRVVTDGTISNGDHVKAGATGFVTKASTTDRSFGIALIGTDQSNASGDVIAIQHCVPHLYVF